MEPYECDEDWQTRVHEPGRCATYGICGHRRDGDPLSCPDNGEARPLNATSAQKLQTVCPQLAADIGPGAGVCCTEEQLDQLQKQIQIASIFLVGCPACNHNFKHFFCLLTCSPDQAAFANVTAVQPAHDNNATAVAEIDYFVASSFGERFYNSCKDVVYPVMNQPAMNFVGGGARDFQEWFDFIGLVKDKRFPPTGSPFQMDFPPEAEAPEGMVLLNGSIPSCGEGALACSCGDCPAGPNCEPPLPPPPPEPPGCPAVGTTRLTCTDLWLAVLYVALLACLPLVVWRSRQQLEEGELRRSQEAEAGGGRPSVAAAGSGGHDSMERVEGAAGAAGDCDAGAHAARVGGGGSQDVGAVRNGGAGSKPSLRAAAAGADQQGEIEEEVAEVEEELVEWPATEQLLRRWFYRLGRGCASRPWRVLAASLLLVGACIAGLGRFSVMTDPAELWVGPGSQAAQEKAAYEAAFGPFYRITQLILTTTPAANSTTTTPSGLPAIVTDAHIKLLFDMQAEIDALVADGAGSSSDASRASGGGGGSWNVSLGDVCLRPLGPGSACATQSVLQYWGMSRDVYEH
ncbi:hypothetical protein ABPG77_009523, partial [Micractinium sp. CCAP 211/92]